ncbi:MAG TPA: Wzz/FepE/Etk N-terminal domain-containing protein [Verrucomicrobiae bacterium]|nr:Wzz/FepE/Etk N-terminal domain-containing protein [Verrucomicrobiae bacterium]
MVHQEIGAKDVVAIVKRRFWLITLLAVFGGAAGFVAARVLPKKYLSKTLVLVQQPEMQPVAPVTVDNVNQRLATMQQQILSTARLEPIIRDLNLYPRDVNRLPMEDVVEEFRESVNVSAVAPMTDTKAQNLPGFTISVTYEHPELAQKICSTITSMFIKGDVQATEESGKVNIDFLNDQLAQKKAELDKQEARLAAFQRENRGKLPEDLQANMNILSGQTTQLEAATQAVNRAQQDKNFAESILAQQLSAWQAAQAGQANPETLDAQLEALQAQLTTLQSKYTDDHPDVIKLKNDIAVMKQKIVRNEQQKASAPPEKPITVGEPTQVLQLRAQIHQYDTVIKERTAQQEELKKQIEIYQARVAATPEIEQEYKLITRDHDTVLGTYNDLLKRRNDAQMSSQYIDSKQDDRFLVLDPANLPVEPAFPKMPIFAGGGFGAGLALAVGLSMLLEVQDTSMRSEHDVEVVLRLPVLAMIPVISPNSAKAKPQPAAPASLKAKQPAKA